MTIKRQAKAKITARQAASALISAALLTACGGGFIAEEQNSAGMTGAATVKIYRDEMGVPHIQGDTLEATMFGAGYASGQDRLVYLDFIRRLAAGRMAEVFGPDLVEVDQDARTKGYTDAELRQMIDELPEENQRTFRANLRGLNHYIEQALQDPDNFMPIEYKLFGMELSPFTEEDAARITTYATQYYGGVGGQELLNLAFFSELKNRYGDAKAQQIFDDIVVLNDPDADTITHRDKTRERSASVASRPVQTDASPALVNLIDAWHSTQLARANIERSLGLSRGASRSLTIAPSRSADGRLMMMQSTADGSEVHLSGGGLDAAGLVTTYGPPGMGRGPQHGWLITTGESDTIDIMEHRLNPDDPEQYWYQEAWKRFETRQETIQVRGADPVNITVRRSVQGPVILHELEHQRAYAYKAAIRGQELQMSKAVSQFGRARSLEEFREAVRGVVQNYNITYGGEDGHIELWHTGLQPVRPPSVDPRLPAPGDGSADWLGFLPFEEWVNEANPEAGYFFAWNNKPSPDSTYGDSSRYGQHFRTWLAHELVASKEKISLDDMKEINRKLSHGFGGIDLSSTSPAFFARYLRAAVADDSNAERRAAVDHMLAWDGIYEDLDQDGFYDDLGISLFNTWRSIALKAIFEDDIGDWAEKLDEPLYVKYRTSLLLRALQGDEAGKPFVVDYFNGRSKDEVIRETLDATLTALEARFGSRDMASWRQPVYWRYFDEAAFAADNDTALDDTPMSMLGSAAVQLGKIPKRILHNGNENWNAIMIIDAARPPLLSIIPTGGQSRFIRMDGVASPHIADQIERHRTLDFKELPLTARDVRKAAKAPPIVLTYTP